MERLGEIYNYNDDSEIIVLFKCQQCGQCCKANKCHYYDETVKMNHCKNYKDRPEACRLYPLMTDFGIDGAAYSGCPGAMEFQNRRRRFRRLKGFMSADKMLIDIRRE